MDQTNASYALCSREVIMAISDIVIISEFLGRLLAGIVASMIIVIATGNFRKFFLKKETNKIRVSFICGIVLCAIYIINWFNYGNQYQGYVSQNYEVCTHGGRITKIYICNRVEGIFQGLGFFLGSLIHIKFLKRKQKRVGE
ncbi:MAG: hypothetical protein O9296_11215 [Novosphingobium sp.]|jgi:hypothetical protein|nr:hypothetical protein [Novosphingobium sp.]